LQAGIEALIAKAQLPSGEVLAISGASGSHKATVAEKAVLDAASGVAARGFSTLTGHMKEAQFPFAVALAALAIHHDAAYPPFAAGERDFGGAPKTVLATAVGYHHFEGMALVGKAG
jgi:3-oxoacyl-[acyl-carrier-protein] synthase II